MKLYCVNDNVPVRTVQTLREACVPRRIEFVEVHAGVFDYAPERQLTGDGSELMYRPAISLTAQRVEQFLFSPGVSTFYRDDERIFFQCSNPVLLHQRTGLPIPRTIFSAGSNRDLLRRHVESLGGFPVVVKAMGFSGGLGVMRVDSLPSLLSLMDFALAKGSVPLLCAYVGDAVHWRLTVVGDRVVAAYKNVQDDGDFRTYASVDPRNFTLDPDPEMASIAVRAVQQQGVDFGGVDLLQHATGRVYLLEANFPCYFATAQDAIGVDISGMMIDYLAAKAERAVATKGGSADHGSSRPTLTGEPLAAPLRSVGLLS